MMRPEVTNYSYVRIHTSRGSVGKDEIEMEKERAEDKYNKTIGIQ